MRKSTFNMRCHICENADVSLLDKPLQVFVCTRCKHESSALPFERQETYSPEYFLEKHRKWFEYPNLALFNRIRAAVERYTAGKSSISFLDIGCGQGDLLRHLKAAGSRAKLFGIDLAPNADEGISYYQGD